jgi:CrcB protein
MWCSDSEGIMVTKRLLLIFFGGGVGSVLRFIVALLLNAPTNAFPIGILVVNVVGSFIMGFLFQLLPRYGMHNSYLFYLLMTGVLGGFTTFSAFSINTVSLFMSDRLLLAVINILASVVFSLFAAYVGILCSRIFFA